MDLINMLTSQLGIKEDQAAGGAGLIFNLAKEKLGGDFSQVTNALPEVNNLIDKAPTSSGSGVMGALGGLASSFGADKLGNLASLAGGFSYLNLDSSLIPKFLPIILEYVKNKAGSGIVDLISKALK